MHATSTRSFINHIIMGISAGTFYAGISALLKHIGPNLQPLWPDYDYIGAHIPWLNMALINGTLFVTLFIQAFLIFVGIDYATQGWQRRKIIGSILCILLGIGLTGTASIETITWWLISGFIRGIVFLLLYIHSFRHERIRIMWALTTLFVCTIVQQMFFNAWPGAILGGTISIALIILVSFIWSWSLLNKKLQ